MQLKTNVTVLMLGARRCGKSTTLASMIKSLDYSNASIAVEYTNDETRQYLHEKYTLIQDVFSDTNIANGYWLGDADVTGSDSDIKKFDLSVKIHKKLTVEVLCIDIPGEILQTDMPKACEAIEKADVLMIAVDTPQLYEGGNAGKIFNQVESITDLLANALIPKKLYNKRIIFVPIKCEKYVRSGEMVKVNDRIKTVYQDLIRLWTETAQKKVFITPVLSLGDIEFSHFRKVDNGTNVAYYKYTGNKNHSPKWCEQPILYAIEFALEQMPWESYTNKSISWYKRVTNKVLGYIDDLL